MKRLELHLNKNLLINNIVYIDRNNSIEIEKQKAISIIEEIYGQTYHSHNCNYEFHSLPIKEIMVGDKIQQLHNIIVNVSIPDLEYRDIRAFLSRMANNLESFDNFIYNLIKPLINPQMTIIFRFITELGNFPFIILVLLSIYTFSKDKNLKIYASLNALAVFIINFLLKSIFPLYADEPAIIIFGFSLRASSSILS